MKAIQVTQDLKEKNSDFFNNNAVGTIVQKTIPNRFNGAENIVGGYASREDLQALDGWKDVIQPTFDSATQRRGNTLVLDGNIYTYEVIDLTIEEIEAKIPTTISKLNFKLGLLKEHGITNAMVNQVIAQVPDEVLKEMLNLLWYESATIDRTDTELLQFAPYLGLTENNLKNICEKYANFR